MNLADLEGIVQQSDISDLSLRVPATCANLGPGFDILGIAISQYTHFQFHFTPELRYPIFDKAKEVVAIPENLNYVKQGFEAVLQERGLKVQTGFETTVEWDIPVARGFGSSASAYVAGVAAGNHVLTVLKAKPLGLAEELRILSRLEGHPDNVCPARLGGWVAGFLREDGHVETLHKKLPPSLGLAVLIPEIQISTKSSRKKLPEKLPLPDILTNMQGVMLWLEFIHTGRIDLLRAALRCDRIHEPYRKAGIPGYALLLEKIEGTEMVGATISGSGPGIVVYYEKDRETTLVPWLRATVEDIYSKTGMACNMKVCNVDYEGLKIQAS